MAKSHRPMFAVWQMDQTAHGVLMDIWQTLHLTLIQHSKQLQVYQERRKYTENGSWTVNPPADVSCGAWILAAWLGLRPWTWTAGTPWRDWRRRHTVSKHEARTVHTQTQQATWAHKATGVMDCNAAALKVTAEHLLSNVQWGYIRHVSTCLWLTAAANITNQCSFSHYAASSS